MVSQKERPLASVWNFRRLAQDLRNGMAVGLAQCHEDTRHERKVKGHMAFVLVTEIRSYVRWPLVCLSQKHARLVVLVEKAAQFLQYTVSLGEVLIDRTLTLT